MAGQSRNGFSLLEIIGVVAILVILGTLLIPRILHSRGVSGTIQGVNKAQINGLVMAIQAVKTATTEHCARFGTLASSNGAPLKVQGSYDRFDTVLLSEQLLERPFSVRIGSGAQVRLENVSGLSASTRVDANGGAYDLQGRGANDITGASYLVEAIISGLTETEAKAVNDELDGPALGSIPGENDYKGRVTYRLTPNGAAGDVHIYIAHK